MDNQIFEKIHPKKELGQNFLLSEKALEEIIQSAELNLNDIVLEIGAGTGILTQALAGKVKRVTAIEKDKRLISILQERFEKYQNVEIVSGDIREIIEELESYKGHKE